MSAKKVKEVDSIYSGSSAKRSRIFDDISCSSNVTSTGWKSILSCCWRRDRGRKPTLKEYNPNEWDYIVEKLVVKRVPLSLYATEEDFQEFIDEKKYKDSSYSPAVKEMRDKQVYSAMPEMGSTLYFLKNKARGDLLNKRSSKNLRFNREKDLLDEDVVQAGTSNYNRDISSRTREDDVADEYLNRFSALHPDLKEAERPPKDPDPLNPPRSKRSLAENISEIASTKKNPNTKSKTGKEKNKHGSNVYATVSDTSREISTVLGEEEIPTRDKNITKNTTSIFRKIGSTSCLSYSQKLLKTRGAESEGGKQIRQEADSPYNQRKLSGEHNEREFNNKSLHKASQLKMNKAVELNPCELDTGFTSQRKNYPQLSKSADKEFTTDATSYTSDDFKNANLAGTTLRWKIIIKHHQPTVASQIANESSLDLPESLTLPVLNSFSDTKLINKNTDCLDNTRIDDTMGYKNE